MILLKSMYNKGSNFVIDKKNRLLELGKFNSKSVMQEFLEAKKIESMDVINKALKKKDKLEKRVAEAKDKAKA